MLLNEILSIKSSRKELKSFGLTVGIVLIALGALFFWKDKSYYLYVGGIGAALVLLGLTAPLILLPVQKAWMCLALLMGWVMTRVILTLLFLLAIIPIGIITKMMGKDFLDRKIDPSKDTYWIPRGPKRARESYENQF